MMMPTRHQFSAFAPENTPLLRENQYNYLRFNFLNPPVHYPRTHDSNIPEFQHSNCERSELTWNSLHFVQNYFRHQDTKTQTQVEWFRVQRSGLKNIQPVRIKGILSSTVL